tara:strand:- start:437 stop:697 length:261 start_codon:yes stop_codon:yes gene_type:complete
MTLLKPITHCPNCKKEYTIDEKNVVDEIARCSNCNTVANGKDFWEVFVKTETTEQIQQHVKESLSFNNSPKTFSKDGPDGDSEENL